jgi:hypothetical protein
MLSSSFRNTSSVEEHPGGDVPLSPRIRNIHRTRSFGARALPAALPLVLVALLATACGDDPTDPFPDRFGLTVTVRTPGGAPVGGLRMAVSPALDERFVRWPYAKACVRVLADLPPGVAFSLRIYDLEGYLIRHIEKEAAHQFVVWSGKDDNGQPVHDGVYRYVTEREGDDGVVRDEGHLVFIAGDPDFYIAGVTDADGRLTVRDPTYVPAFYDLEPISVLTYPEGTEELLVLPARVRLTLLADDGRYQAVEVDVAPRPQATTVVWEPKEPRH